MYMPKSAVPVQSNSGYMPKSARPVQGGYNPNASTSDYLKGAVGNILPSAGKMALGMGEAVVNAFNPDLSKNTIANMSRLGMGVVQKLDPTPNKTISTVTQALNPATMYDRYMGKSTDYQPQAEAVGKFYKDRYGGVDNIKKSLYEDPTGVALDAATILSGAGGLVKGAGTLTKSAKIAQIGKGLETAGELINPISLAGKGVGAVARPIINRAKPLIAGIGEDLSVRAMRPSKTQLTNFEEATGTSFKDYVKAEGISGDAQGAYSQIQSKIKPLQEKYNAMVRSGKEVDIQKYADALRKQALEILDKDRSASARSVAEKLWNEADMQQSMGNITDTVLTNTKSSQFSKVPGGVMSDPIAANFSKESGIAGVKALEDISKGSSELGRKLKLAREFEDIVKNQANVSKGTQIFNTVKPAFAGFMTGAASGSFIPGVGNLAGGLAGAGSAIALNNPKVMSMLGQYLQKAGKVGSKVKMPNTNIFSKLLKSAQYQRMVNPK
jgi:hypothetical protein